MSWTDLITYLGDGPVKAVAIAALLHGVRELSKMRKSVEKLNVGMAVIVEKVHGHDRRIAKLERGKK